MEGLTSNGFKINEITEFQTKIRPDLLIPCMRLKKLIEIDKFLQTNCALLMKGPPGSGKTTMADLFKFYLQITQPTALCYRFNVNKGIKSDDDLLALFKSKLDIFLPNFYLKNLDDFNQKIYIIIDECHMIYGDKENQAFENFWKLIKEIVEGPDQVHLKFLFCAVYSDSRIKGESLLRSPLVLKDRFRGFDFLKFTQDEFKEIMNYYSNSAHSETFPLTDDKIKQLIWRESNGFPQLTMKTIMFMRENLNKSDKSYKTIHEAMFSTKFQNEVVHTLKSFSAIFEKLNDDMRLFLRKVHIVTQCYVDPHTKEYDMAKYLESYGVIVENSNNYFFFPTRSLSSAYFSLICNDHSQEKIPKDTLLKMDKVTLALTALQRMKLDNIIKVSKTKAKKTKDGKPSEDQWILEFYCALRSMISSEYEIHSQFSKVIDSKFIGELDLYISDEINLPIEVTGDGNTVKYHILRNYMDIYPDNLIQYEDKVTDRYLYPNPEKYLVIEFRETEEFTKISSIVDDGKGNKIDLGSLMMKDLMRVCYNDFSKISVYYEEKLLTTIIPSI